MLFKTTLYKSIQNLLHLHYFYYHKFTISRCYCMCFDIPKAFCTVAQTQRSQDWPQSQIQVAATFSKVIHIAQEQQGQMLCFWLEKEKTKVIDSFSSPGSLVEARMQPWLSTQLEVQVAFCDGLLSADQKQWSVACPGEQKLHPLDPVGGVMLPPMGMGACVPSPARIPVSLLSERCRLREMKLWVMEKQMQTWNQGPVVKVLLAVIVMSFFQVPGKRY